MPELPEVETLKNELTRTILGKKIKRVEIRLPKMVALGPKTVSNLRKTSLKTVAGFQNLLSGQKIVGVRRRAKLLILDLSSRPYVLLIHLKLTGQLIFVKKGERKKVKIMNLDGAPRLELPHKYTHLILDFTDGSHLYYNDLRQFGYLRLVAKKDLSEVFELDQYGPEPYANEFNLEYLLHRAKKRRGLTIKQFLMDPKVVAGIGNIYSDEILYWSKLKPNRKLPSLQKEDWKALFTNIPLVLTKAIKAHGSSVGDFFKLDGSEGEFGKQHMVYGRGGEQCRKCGSLIQTLKLGGRTSSFCPLCQK